jgi:hypothetical protein
MKHSIVLSLAFCIVFLIYPSTGNAKKPSSQNKNILIQYEGSILDESKKAVSGIFPLKFEIYNKDKGGKALWSEHHYIAVEEGKYEIELGIQTPIPSNLPVNKLYIAISLGNEGEIVREQLVLSEDKEEGQPQPIEEDTGSKKKQPVSLTRVDFAMEAEHAEDSDKLSGMTTEDLMIKIMSQTKISVGSEKKHSSKGVGFDNGTKDTLTCPLGEVVVGLTVRYGQSQLYKIQLICSPLVTGEREVQQKPEEEAPEQESP